VKLSILKMLKLQIGGLFQNGHVAQNIGMLRKQPVGR
jgi:hypothetical protein